MKGQAAHEHIHALVKHCTALNIYHQLQAADWGAIRRQGRAEVLRQYPHARKQAQGACPSSKWSTQRSQAAALCRCHAGDGSKQLAVSGRLELEQQHTAPEQMPLCAQKKRRHKTQHSASAIELHVLQAGRHVPQGLCLSE